jgi:hypothetical protein
MYTLLLLLHSWIRWALLGAALASLGKSFSGWNSGRDWEPGDEKLARATVGMVHGQLLIGLLLYAFYSPITQAAFADFGAAMKDRALRFYAVEHIAGMLLAVAVIMATRVRSKRVEGAARHRVWGLGLAFFLLVVAAMVPWPGLSYGRPWVRLGL